MRTELQTYSRVSKQGGRFSARHAFNKQPSLRWPRVLVLLVLAPACSGSTTGSSGSGGSGGATGTASGGTTGNTGSGGGSGTGGRSSGTGGISTTAGSGGAPAGSGGTSSGSGGQGGAAARTAGCGIATWPAANDGTNGVTYKIDISGTMREYYVSLPTGYTSAEPHPVVFAWHVRGGTAKSLTGRGFGGNYYGLKTRVPHAIYVAAQGLGTASDAADTGWPNTNGQDVALTKALVTWVEANYCVDTARIFSTGFSYGAIMSETLACQMSDVFRAIGAMSGSLFGRATCGKAVAVWITHGTADATLAISGDETARDAFVKLNHCGATTQATSPSPCVSYDGCDAGYPVVWCPVEGGGHEIPTFAADAVGQFFLRF